MEVRDLIEGLKRGGFTFFTGVPCSYLTPLINAAIADRETSYVGATSEGEAVAIAAGAWLAGQKAVVLLQNSGLGNTVNPLTSLNYPFRIPTLLIVTWRGQPGTHDEPQHELMGAITTTLLSTCQVGWCHLPQTRDDLQRTLTMVDLRSLPYALVVEKAAIAGQIAVALESAAPKSGHLEDRRVGGRKPSRFEALEHFLQAARSDAAVVATTGKCGRELFTIADREQHLYQVGSMGCASAMGLGIALNTKRPVVVLDGDGAALMKLGNLATIGRFAPRNLIHIIFNNEVYDSTGGQATAAVNVDFCAVAAAAGYARATICDDLARFDESVRRAFENDGPQLIEMKVSPGSLDKLGRPTIGPAEVASRFRAFLAGPAAHESNRLIDPYHDTAARRSG